VVAAVEERVISVLLISVWTHDRSLVAQLRGYRDIGGEPERLGAVAGKEGILASVAQWLDSVEAACRNKPNGTKP
jgi:hypothetical protein